MTDNIENKIVDAITEIYHFTQYGKLMPGFIHNTNGKLTGLDSKIQLTQMKLQMKLKKLEQNSEYPQDVKTILTKEYSDILTMFNQLNESKNELNGLLSLLNNKVSTENLYEITLVDLNSTINEFHLFFQFYKRYKHNITINFEFEGAPFVKIENRDLFFLLYAVVRNAVDAMTHQNHEENILTYKTQNFDHFVELSIINNGKAIPSDFDPFQPLNSDKKTFGSMDATDHEPIGSGLDLFFLKKKLEKYPTLSYSWTSTAKETIFKFTIPKR